MLQRVRLRASDLIVPVFVHDGPKLEVASMPGVFRLGVDDAADWLDSMAELGIGGYLVFGVLGDDQKDAVGSSGEAGDNVVCRLLRETQRRGNPMLAITDVCLCEYTDHGHCAPLVDGEADNDAALAKLGRQAVIHAEAGADWVAPSAAMDGMVAAIRRGLDDAGHHQTAIMSYAIKYAGAFYGPFRDAAASAPSTGDRKSYQMDPFRGTDEAIREAELDVAEGADVVMVKPAGPYLDVLSAMRQAVRVPTAAYQTSGEYAMHMAGGQQGWIDLDAVVMESTMAMRRAGADLVITYHAERLARMLATGS